MAGTSNIHWAQDEELVERYARNQVTATERKSLEEHLRSCQDCRGAVEREAEFVMGIRTYGRERLKERLRLRSTQGAGNAVVWTRVVSAAAVLVILVGFGVYNRWLFVDEKPASGELEKPAEQNAEASGREATRADVPSQKKGASDIHSGPEKQGAGALRKRETDAAGKKALKPAISIDAEVQALSGQSGAGAPTKRLEKEMIADEIKESRASEADDSNEFWIEGYLLPQTPPDAKDQTHRAFSAPASQLKSKTESSGDVQVSAIQSEDITLEQRPAATMPRDRQSKQGFSKGRSVQTLVQKTDEGMKMTLFLETPTTEGEFLDARVQRISPDSIVVELPNQRIGYLLPTQLKFDHTKKIEKK